MHTGFLCQSIQFPEKRLPPEEKAAPLADPRGFAAAVLLSKELPGEAGAGVSVGLRPVPVFDRILAGRRRARRFRAPVLLPMGERLRPLGTDRPRMDPEA